MAGSLNRVMLIGTLGRDPEVRAAGNGGKVANLSLATSESWKDGNGERKERTEWHNVVMWGDGLANVAEKYLRKGSKVYIEGKLQTRKWKDKNGNDRYSTEIVCTQFIMMDKPAGNGSGQQRNETASQIEDGIPF